jgi:chromosome segregation ATPase
MFADPVNWDNERAYEPLTIVVYNGDCYTSKCFVPVGADISNSLYWVKSQDYNYQFDQLKQVVADLSKQVTAFAGDNAKFTELINNFSTEFATMQTEFSKWSVQFPAMNERIDAAEADIDALQAADAETAKTIDGLKKTDSELAGRLDGHDTDIEGLRAKDVEQDGRLDAIEAKNTQYDADIAALKAKDADQQTQLDTIKAKDNEQDTRLDGIDAKLTQNTADIAKNTKNIQDNATNIAANAQELANHAEQLKDHEARLTAQRKEITDNRTAIERNTSDIAGLRSDLTEAEANIAQNADAISHIQEKDVQQDARLDSLEQRATTAEGRLDGLDTKTDATNTALTEEVNRAKAAELKNGELIAKNADELASHAQELADHETRITALEGDNATNKQDIADIKAKNIQQDTAISGNTDAIAHINDSLAGYVTSETYTAGQAAQDTKINAAQAAADRANTNIGNWTTDHPGQTISECATSQENELTEHAGSIAKLEADKADKTAIPDVSGFVTQTTYDAGQATQDERLDALENAHHYANLEEALKDKGRGGYMDIIESNANFIFNPSTVSKDATVTYKNNVTFRIQLPQDSVIEDTTTVPTGSLTVCPHFSYRRTPDNSYMTTNTCYDWDIVSSRYFPSIQCVDVIVAPVVSDLPFIPVGDTPLFWDFAAQYE